MTDTVILNFNTLVRNCLISTSALKSDVIIAFLTQISCTSRELQRFANVVGRNWHIYVFMDCQDLLAQNDSFMG